MFPLHAAGETSQYTGKIIFQQLGLCADDQLQICNTPLGTWEAMYDVHGRT